MRTALLYLLLVGAPALGVAALLRAGERLTPPATVGGAWLVTAEGPARPACAPLGERPGVPVPLVIEQSGTRVRAETNGGRFRGTFDGGALRVRVPALACPAWRIEGRLREAQLAGRLIPEGCACAPVAFTAVRDTAGAASSAAGGH